MAVDPLETRDVAAEHPEIVAQLRQRYEAWFRDVSATRPDNYAPPRILHLTSAGRAWASGQPYCPD